MSSNIKVLRCVNPYLRVHRTKLGEIGKKLPDWALLCIQSGLKSSEDYSQGSTETRRMHGLIAALFQYIWNNRGWSHDNIVISLQEIGKIANLKLIAEGLGDVEYRYIQAIGKKNGSAGDVFHQQDTDILSDVLNVPYDPICMVIQASLPVKKIAGTWTMLLGGFAGVINSICDGLWTPNAEKGQIKGVLERVSDDVSLAERKKRILQRLFKHAYEITGSDTLIPIAHTDSLRISMRVGTKHIGVSTIPDILWNTQCRHNGFELPQILCQDWPSASSKLVQWYDTDAKPELDFHNIYNKPRARFAVHGTDVQISEVVGDFDFSAGTDLCRSEVLDVEIYVQEGAELYQEDGESRVNLSAIASGIATMLHSQID